MRIQQDFFYINDHIESHLSSRSQMSNIRWSSQMDDEISKISSAYIIT